MIWFLWNDWFVLNSPDRSTWVSDKTEGVSFLLIGRCDRSSSFFCVSDPLVLVKGLILSLHRSSSRWTLCKHSPVTTIFFVGYNYFDEASRRVGLFLCRKSDKAIHFVKCFLLYTTQWLLSCIDTSQTAVLRRTTLTI